MRRSVIMMKGVKKKQTKKKVQLKEINVFTDWMAYVIYCSSDDAKPILAKLYPDIEGKDFEHSNAIFFSNLCQVPLIWINANERKTDKEKLLAIVHECNHLVLWIGDRIGIDSDEWHSETLEHVVKQGIKLLNIKKL